MKIVQTFRSFESLRVEFLVLYSNGLEPLGPLKVEKTHLKMTACKNREMVVSPVGCKHFLGYPSQNKSDLCPFLEEVSHLEQHQCQLSKLQQSPCMKYNQQPNPTETLSPRAPPSANSQRKRMLCIKSL